MTLKQKLVKKLARDHVWFGVIEKRGWDFRGRNLEIF
jgi:hypothetical protein